MRTWLSFLRRHPAWWLPPILLYLAFFAWLAVGIASTPENPFNYSLR